MTRVCGSLQASLRPIVSGSHVSPVSADHVHRICHLTPWTTTKSSIYNFILGRGPLFYVDHNWSPWPYWRSFEPPHLIVSAGQSLRANDDVQYNIQDDLRWTLQHYNITRAENLMNRLVFKCRSRVSVGAQDAWIRNSDNIIISDGESDRSLLTLRLPVRGQYWHHECN